MTKAIVQKTEILASLNGDTIVARIINKSPISARLHAGPPGEKGDPGVVDLAEVEPIVDQAVQNITLDLGTFN